MARIRTILLEDEKFHQEGIKALLATIPNVLLIGMFRKSRIALQQCIELQPDLVIVDAQIGPTRHFKGIGPEFVRDLKQELPEVRVMGITQYVDCLDALSLLSHPFRRLDDAEIGTGN